MKPWLAFISSPLFLAVAFCDTAAAQSDAGMLTLAKAKNCTTCHSVDKKIVGPAYKDVARRYAGQKGIEATLVDKVLKGGKGNWKKELGSEIMMPPNPGVSPEDAKKLVQWILGLK